MARDKGVWLIAGFSIIIYLLLIIIGYLRGVTAFTAECVIFICLTIFYYVIYEKVNLTPVIFTLLSIGHITHALGIFGFYNISPLPIGWERITHFFGMMPFAMFFFNYFKHKWDIKIITRKNLIMIIVVFFAAMGVGQIAEASEFWGYLNFGEGKGAFMFGHGDGVMTAEGKEIMDIQGGGWINSGWDITWNMIGIIFGMFIMILFQWFIRPKKEELDLHELERLYLQDKKGYSQKF